MRLDAALSALLVLLVMLVLVGVSGGSAVLVPPPTDVTVSCHNLTTKVRWDYSREQPATTFRVNVGGYDVVYETADHELDLSHFVWESSEHYLAFLYVTVTAVLGGNQSEAAKSNTFSFNNLKTTHLTCRLEFPPVDLTVGELGPTVGFKNPLHLYEELKQFNKEDGASFMFTVFTDDEAFEASCTDHTCRCDVSFPDGAEPCVQLKGKLCNKDCVGEIQFRDTEHICLKTSADVLMITLALMLGIFAFVIIVITTIICKEKAWTMEKPRVLEINPGDTQLQYNTLPSKEDYSIAIVTQKDANSKCYKSPSISSDDDDWPANDPRNGSSIVDFQSADGAYRDGGLSEDSNQVLETGGHRTDDDSADDSVKTECVSLDSEEAGEENDYEDPYDRPHVPTALLDMGDGDVVACYNGR